MTLDQKVTAVARDRAALKWMDVVPHGGGWAVFGVFTGGEGVVFDQVPELGAAQALLDRYCAEFAAAAAPAPAPAPAPRPEPTCPQAEACIARLRALLTQYDEGAITSPECALGALTQAFDVEIVEALGAEASALRAYYGEPSWLAGE